MHVNTAALQGDHYQCCVRVSKCTLVASNMNEDSCSEVLDLLQPELWSRDSLVRHLNNQQVTGIEDLEKDALVEIFHRVAVPLPQRKYRTNRRGILMAKSQKQRDGLKRKLTLSAPSPSGSSNMPESSRSSGQSRFLCSYSPSPQTVERLKPPVNAVNFERKIIKLGVNKTDGVSSKVAPHNKEIASPSNKVTLAKSSSSSKTTTSLEKTVKTVSVSPYNKSAEERSRSVMAATPTRKIKLNRKTGSQSNGISCDDSSASKDMDALEPQSPEAVRNSPEEKLGKHSNADEDEGLLRKKFKRIDIKFP